MNFNEIELGQFGHTIHMVGNIYKDFQNETEYHLYLPKREAASIVDVIDDLTLENWHDLNRQLDLLETEIFTPDENGKLVRITVRKSQRQISQAVNWACFRRDNYTCRYCGANDVPLTTDHLVLWEEMGESTEENMLTSCKPCNQARGSLQFEEWLESEYYLKVSKGEKKFKGISSEIHKANWALVPTLKDLPRRIHKRSKR